MNKSELIELLKDYKQNIAKLKLRKREKEKMIKIIMGERNFSR